MYTAIIINIIFIFFIIIIVVRTSLIMLIYVGINAEQELLVSRTSHTVRFTSVSRKINLLIEKVVKKKYSFIINLFLYNPNIITIHE